MAPKKVQVQLSTEPISEVQMSLNYAKQVAQVVTHRRIKDLQLQRQQLLALPVTHPVDLDLRGELLRALNAQLKQLTDEP